MHFEDIWNEAENISATMPKDLENFALESKAISLKLVKKIVLGSDDDPEKLVGEMLFVLCGICKAYEKESITINSAKALREEMERRKAG
jgi:hypothetical protein